MRVIFTASDSEAANEILNRLGVKDRLISYYYLTSSSASFIPTYVERGTYTKRKRLKKGVRGEPTDDPDQS